MFGWGQKTIPLGKGLWLALIISLICALYFQPPWLSLLAHPLEDPLELLRILGQILFLDLCLNLGFFVLFEAAETIGYRIDNRRRDPFFVQLEYHPSHQGCLTPFFSVLFYFISFNFGPALDLPWWGAAFGWSFLLFVGTADALNEPSIRFYDFVHLLEREDWDMLTIVHQTNKKRTSSTFEIGWDNAITYLTSNNWELVETSQIEVKEGRKKLWAKKALFRRGYEVSPGAFSDIRGKVEDYIHRNMDL